MASPVKIFFDGGCRPEPVGMETAVVVRGQAYVERGLGPGSGMDAEWLALIAAVRIAQSSGLEDVVFLGDATAVIAQANGTVKCRAGFVQYFETLTALKAAPGPLRIRYVKRAQNLAGIALARLHGR